MSEIIAAFEIIDGFFITGRGLVLLGRLAGSALLGCHVVLPGKIDWRIRGVEDVRYQQQELRGLLVEADIASRPQLLALDIVGQTAQIQLPHAYPRPHYLRQP